MPERNPVTLQELESSRDTGVPRSTRLPLFVVEIAYTEGVEEMAGSSARIWEDLSELVTFSPSENEFHTRLEVHQDPLQQLDVYMCVYTAVRSSVSSNLIFTSCVMIVRSHVLRNVYVLV